MAKQKAKQPQPKPQQPETSEYCRQRLVDVSFDSQTLIELRPYARVRGRNVPQLLRDIIDAVARDRLVNAVLPLEDD